MNESASQLIGQLAAGFADRLDETMEQGEKPFAALVCVWTTKGVHWHIGTSGRPAETKDVMKLLDELKLAASETALKDAGRIG